MKAGQLGARGSLMLHDSDSYAHACGFESGLGHCAYGTFGKSLLYYTSSYAAGLVDRHVNRRP